MKTFYLICITVLITGCRYDNPEEKTSNNLIRIFRWTPNYLNNDGFYRDQFEIDLTNGLIKFREKINKKFLIYENFELAKYFVDSVKYDRMIKIVESYVSDDKENLCDFHNEKGYIIIQLVKRKYSNDDVIFKSFIISQTYRCENSEDSLLIDNFIKRYIELKTNIKK